MKIVNLSTALDNVKWSLGKIKEHLEGGFPDRALVRTKETIRAIEKFEDFRGKGYLIKPKGHPPSKVCV
jgi:hypothetical protein